MNIRPQIGLTLMSLPENTRPPRGRERRRDEAGKAWLRGIRNIRLLGVLLGFLAWSARGEIQFDVFLGFDGTASTAGWIPVACEVNNDGPGFTARFELLNEGGDDSVARRFTVELPTKTRKRFVIPLFATSKYATWRARLVDENGKERALLENLRPTREVSWRTPILGVLGKGLIRIPDLPKIKTNRDEWQPAACRLQAGLFPDDPLALDSLTALYLGSTTALDLAPAQASAIHTWVERGGHLIVGVDQASEISAAPWLEDLLPMQFSGMGQVAAGKGFQAWLAEPWYPNSSPLAGADSNLASRRAAAAVGVFGQLKPDPDFEEKNLLVALGRVTGGKVLAARDSVPLMVETRRGYGIVTLLTFNPDRPPFIDWKNQPWFWLKAMRADPELYSTSDFNIAAGNSLDGVISALIETKQVRKLPVKWLLVILGVYLLVIGPFDWYSLKKIRRQMWTWVTFPVYVALFSGLIYFIGFKLRAGKVEWNDLSVVDIWPMRDTALLCGRTYGSIYSPSNDRYRLGGSQPVSAIRGEFVTRYSSAEEIGAGEMRITGSRAEALGYVPIWTSRLFVNDWLDTAPAPFHLEVTRIPEDPQPPPANQKPRPAPAGRMARQWGWRVVLQNLTDHPLVAPRLVVGERFYELGGVPAHGVLDTNLFSRGYRTVSSMVDSSRMAMNQAVQRHQSAFGQTKDPAPVNATECAMAASLMPDLSWIDPAQSFLTRDRLVIPPEMRDGKAILLVWDDKSDIAKPVYQFTPSMQTRRNLLRLAVPVLEPNP